MGLKSGFKTIDADEEGSEKVCKECNKHTNCHNLVNSTILYF